MYFSLISAAAICCLLLPIANAVNAVGYSNTVSCSGSAFVCTNLPQFNCCGSYPTGYGYSIQFESLPAGTKGQGYRDTGCTSWIFTLYGSGNKCWNGGGSERARTTNWFYDSSRRRGLEGGSDADCVSPDEFRYTTDDGVEHRVSIPTGEGEAQKLADAYAAKNFNALAAYNKA